MKKNSALFPMAVVFGLLFAAASGFAQTRRVKFTVHDSAGKAIEGVAISMTSPENAEFKKTVLTDKKGQCKFLIPMEIANVKAVLEKEGFQKLEQSLPLKQLRSSQDSLSYESSFLLYGSDERSPQQQLQDVQDKKESRVQFDLGGRAFYEGGFYRRHRSVP